MQKELLSGNEAVARGAYEAGITFASAYPGTPSTEILENISKYKDHIYCQWGSNEKTALEEALGASFAGARSIVAMKHVGLNVAADPLFSASYIGTTGGFIIVSADDPGMHSSQNEQDNRNYAIAAKMPVIEPSDSQEAKDFIIEGIKISEEYNTPVMLRMTTRVNHSKNSAITSNIIIL
jgi:indolepyruvate ferredoxin oxidoreductase alpha subunit